MTECGLTNLATCLPQMFFEFIVNMLNLAVEPLVNLNHLLLTEAVNINIFHSFWAIIIYMISIFYGLFFMFAGFNLMTSGYNVAKRERAKEWLWNVVMMVIFVQASFLIYDLVIEMSSLMTMGIMDMITPDFFLLTADSIVNFGLQLILLIPYIAVLLVTALFLALRYFVVAVGVVILPIGIFMYFIPPLRSYGKLIFNILGGAIFLPFFNAILLFGAAALLDIPLFDNFKIVLVTAAYIAIEILMVIMGIFAVVKSAFSVANSDVGKAVKTAGKYLV